MATKYDNSGTVFVNDRKEKDSHPDRTGTATINGVEYWVSGWIKQPNPDKPSFLSLSFKRKDEKPQEESRKPARADDSDIPW